MRSSQPMVLRAIAAPIEMPSPPAKPPARLAATPAIVASIFDVFFAVTKTLPALVSLLSSAYARTLPPIVLSATAPAPARPPPMRPTLTDNAAAIDLASIDASSTASIVRFPVRDVTSASAMKAETPLSMVLVAIDTPMATDSPPRPNEAAIEAAAVSAVMVDRSAALMLMPVAEMMERVVLTPSMNAATSVAMRFSLAAPAPLRPAAMAPPEIATEPATTKASRSIRLFAATAKVPAAVMPVSCA